MKDSYTFTREEILSFQGKYGRQSNVYLVISLIVFAAGIFLSALYSLAWLFAIFISIYFLLMSNRFFLASLLSISDKNILEIDDRLEKIEHALDDEVFELRVVNGLHSYYCDGGNEQLDIDLVEVGQSDSDWNDMELADTKHPDIDQTDADQPDEDLPDDDISDVGVDGIRERIESAAQNARARVRYDSFE